MSLVSLLKKKNCHKDGQNVLGCRQTWISSERHVTLQTSSHLGKIAIYVHMVMCDTKRDFPEKNVAQRC